MLTRVQSNLSVEVEELAYRVIDSLVTVHRSLGPGYKEIIYQRAACLELDSNGIKYECEKSILVPYKNWKIPGHKIDLIVAGLVIVELKAVPRLKDIYRRQLLSYLKATQIPLGLLVNFNVPVLKGNIRRVIL
jgi:GxxExxY protein